MIQVICDSCNTLVVGPGAVLLSPINQDGDRDEFHLCRACFATAAKVLFDGE